MKHRLPPKRGIPSSAQKTGPRDKPVVSEFKSTRGRPYSSELRAKAVAAVLAGSSCSEVAAQYGLSVSVVGKWVLRFRKTGSAAPKSMGGNRLLRLASERDWVLAVISSQPGLTLRDLHRNLSEKGIVVGYEVLRRFLRKERITLIR